MLIFSLILARAGNSTNNAECRVTMKVTVESEVDVEEPGGSVVYESSNVKVKKLVPYFMMTVLIVMGIFVVWKRPL